MNHSRTQQKERTAGQNEKMDVAVERVRNLKVISNQILRSAVAYCPIVIVILLLADWLVGSRAFSGDLLRLTSVLTVVVELFVLELLFTNLPYALELIWTRDLLCGKSGEEFPGQEFIKYINTLEKALNSRWTMAVGIFGALVGLAATYPVRYFLQSHTSPYSAVGLLAYYLWGNAAIISAPLGYLLGLLTWRVVAIALHISKLGRNFEIRIQPNHPDECGGLGPIGNVCLIIALLLLVPAIFLSLWGFASTFFHSSGTIYNQLWSGMFRQWLVMLIVLSLVAFLWPLYSIHLQMQKQRDEIQTELDALSQKIDVQSKELRTEAYKLTSEQGEEKLKSLDFMEKVYQQNSRIPVWPIHGKTMLRFVSAQVIPVLSLLGTSQPVVKLVESLLASTPK